MSVNDSDRAAASAWISGEMPESLVEHFARHREAERERCVKFLLQLAAEHGHGLLTWAADQLTQEPSDEAK